MVSMASMRPSRSRTMRSQRRTRSSSCVTRISVVPRSRCRANIKLMISPPVRPSRFPVGSSAKSKAGRGAIARGQSHALLLAARQLAWVVIYALTQSDRFQFLQSALEGIGTSASSSGTATFSSAVMVGIRWKDWNTMPTLPRRKRAAVSSSNFESSWPEDGHLAGGRTFKARHHHQHRRFAGARRADQADRLALGHLQVDTVQDIDGTRLAHKCEPDGPRAGAMVLR